MKRRGFTLAELVVGAFLMALLLAVLVGLLIPALRQAARIYGRVEMAQLAMTSFQALARDLGSSARSGIHFTPDSRLLAVQPLEANPTGTARVWTRDLVLFLWEEGSLRRRTWQPLTAVAPGTPTALADAQLQLLRSTPGRERVLARGLEKFEIREASGPCSALQLDCTWVVEGRQTERLRMVRTVLLRNPS